MKCFFHICVMYFSIITSSAQVVFESSNLDLNLSNNYETILISKFSQTILKVKIPTITLEKLNNQFSSNYISHFYRPIKVDFYYLIDTKWIIFHSGIATNFNLNRNMFKSQILNFKVNLDKCYFTSRINNKFLV